jgi:enoyl-CoA hydratase
VASHDSKTTTTLEARDGAYVLTLDRPHAGNSISTAVAAELVAHLDTIESDPGASSLILVGAGERFFCTGGDIKQYVENLTSSELYEQFQTMRSVCQRIEDLPCPTISAINGLAIGGGVELALACDLRLMATDARLQLPQAQLGLVTAWDGARRLVELIGRSRALDLLWTGRTIYAGEAVAIGLANRSVGNALTAGRDLAATLAERNSAAIRSMKLLVAPDPDSRLDASKLAAEVFHRLWPPALGAGSTSAPKLS